MKLIEHFVNGKSFSGDSKRTGKVFNPATGEQSSSVNLASTEDVNKAVAHAKKAFESLARKKNGGFEYVPVLPKSPKRCT